MSEPAFVVPPIDFEEAPDIPSVGIRKHFGFSEVGGKGPTHPTEQGVST